jgi:hypothetical protein
MKTLDLPNKWSEAVVFKDPSKDDKLGFIDAIGRGGGAGGQQQRGGMVTFKFLTAKDEPVSIKPVRAPWECFTLEDVLGKGRGKITMRMQINKKIWESLDDLDMNFRGFLIKHRAKLFSQQDAEYIGRDNSAIALKCKPLAPRNLDGTPMYESFITLRINGRSGEIDTLETKDGATGKFVSKIKWAPRVTPLSAIATRFSIVVGWTLSMSGSPPVPKVKDTLPLSLEDRPVGWSAGDQRVRYVGPGDIADGAKGGSAARYACIRPAYWSLAPGGNASITLVLDSMVVDAGVGDLSAPQDAPDVFVAPEGFAYAEPLEGVEDDARIATLGASSGPTSTMAAAASSSALAGAAAGAGGGAGGGAFAPFNSGTQPRLMSLHKPFSSGGLSNGLYSDLPPNAAGVPMSAPKRTKVERVEVTEYAPPPSRANTGGAADAGVAAGMRTLIAQRNRSLRIFNDDDDDADMPELDDMVPRRSATGGGGGGAGGAAASSSASSSSSSSSAAARQRQEERDAMEQMRYTSTAAYQCTQEEGEDDVE